MWAGNIVPTITTRITFTNDQRRRAAHQQRVQLALKKANTTEEKIKQMVNERIK